MNNMPRSKAYLTYYFVLFKNSVLIYGPSKGDQAVVDEALTKTADQVTEVEGRRSKYTLSLGYNSLPKSNNSQKNI